MSCSLAAGEDLAGLVVTSFSPLRPASEKAGTLSVYNGGEAGPYLDERVDHHRVVHSYSATQKDRDGLIFREPRPVRPVRSVRAS